MELNSAENVSIVESFDAASTAAFIRLVALCRPSRGWLVNLRGTWNGSLKRDACVRGAA